MNDAEALDDDVAERELVAVTLGVNDDDAV